MPRPTKEVAEAQASMTPELAAFLKAADSKWAEATKAAKENPGGSNIPDGRYLARLSSAEFRTDRSGKPGILWQYVVAAGKKEGAKVTRWMNLDGERSLEFLATELARFGIDPESIKPTKLVSILARITKPKPYVEIKQVTNKGKDGKEYPNIYLQEVKDEAFDPEEEAADYADSGEEDDADESEEEDEETSEDSEKDEYAVEIQVGMEVEYPWKGETFTGTIKEIDEENEKVKIRTETSPGKFAVRPVSVEDITVLDAEETEGEEEDEEEEEAPKAAPKARGRK
jgi:hypothetical protein